MKNGLHIRVDVDNLCFDVKSIDLVVSMAQFYGDSHS